ncbi:MAG: FtsX-like permease family protein, partial [Cyclobacteriaceae bacterium]|nr:FtsX-like permease family protein [Cyclobacteriaceae bacterium]
YILYAVIAFGIFGTFLMMVNERKYEFGIMMAIGMKRYRLQVIVFLETIMIALTGTVVGVLLSLPIIIYFFFNPIYFTGEYAELFEKFGVEPILPFSVEPEVFTGQVEVILIITLILALYPLWAILRLKINQAIRG